MKKGLTIKLVAEGDRPPSEDTYNLLAGWIKAAVRMVGLKLISIEDIGESQE